MSTQTTSTQTDLNAFSVNDKVMLRATRADFPKMPDSFLAELTNREDGFISCFNDGEAVVHFGSMHSLQVPTNLLEKRSEID